MRACSQRLTGTAERCMKYCYTLFRVMISALLVYKHVHNHPHLASLDILLPSDPPSLLKAPPPAAPGMSALADLA